MVVLSMANATWPATAVMRRYSAFLPASYRASAVWLTSNLLRTKQTAAAILAAAPNGFAGIEPVEVAALAEQHLGEWQGQERKAFYAARKVGTHTLWFAPADGAARRRGKFRRSGCARRARRSSALPPSIAAATLLR